MINNVLRSADHLSSPSRLAFSHLLTQWEVKHDCFMTIRLHHSEPVSTSREIVAGHIIECRFLSPSLFCLMQVEHPAVDIHLVGIPWVETLYNTCLVIFSGIHSVVRFVFFEEALQ
jgi:hypothetical protein